jgi:hypothetical protein
MRRLKQTICIAVLFLGAAVTACKKREKDVRDYYPSVKTISAVVQPDGSVKVTGAVNDPGATPVTHTGFCVDTIPNPEMLSNQQLSETFDGVVFTTTYKSLNTSIKYYFRSFALNEQGYSYGNSITID